MSAIRPVLLLLSLALSSGAAAQQSSARSAAISSVRYDVTFDVAHARQRTVGVVMSFDVAGMDDVLLSLPIWTPGAYELGNFARFVVRFSATQGGANLRWGKEDPETWRIHPTSAGTVAVQFDYMADTLDNAMTWSAPDLLLFNGTNLFPYPEGRGFDWPATVTIHTEAEWQVATSMAPRGAPSARSWGERNYHDLVDMPFIVGRFDMDSALVAGKWLRFATYPAGSVSGAHRDSVWAVLKAVVPPQAAVFGEVPWRVYTVLQILEPSYRGASGLEHSDSHVDIVSDVDAPYLAGLYAHEIFHAWNVKRLRPVEMTPYRYDRAQPTPTLWVSEGVTDYYADLSMVRGGVSDSAEFLATTETKIGSVAALPATSAEDASLATWISPKDGTKYIYYDQGSLTGLLLDVLIRDASDNRRSLDDVLRSLYQSTYARGRGFANDEWWQAVERAAGRPLGDFRARYVDGREPLPYASVLPLAGIRVQADSIRQVRVGVFSATDSVGERVVDILPGSAAAMAGVRAGDYLLSIGDVIVTGSDFGPKFRARYGNAPAGTPIPIRVRRGTTELELPGEVRSLTVQTFHLSADGAAGAKAARIRSGIFRGVTDSR